MWRIHGDQLVHDGDVDMTGGGDEASQSVIFKSAMRPYKFRRKFPSQDEANQITKKWTNIAEMEYKDHNGLRKTPQYRFIEIIVRGTEAVDDLNLFDFSATDSNYISLISDSEMVSSTNF